MVDIYEQVTLVKEIMLDNVGGPHPISPKEQNQDFPQEILPGGNLDLLKRMKHTKSSTSGL